MLIEFGDAKWFCVRSKCLTITAITLQNRTTTSLTKEGVIDFAPNRRRRRPHTNPYSKTKKQTSRLPVFQPREKPNLFRGHRADDIGISGVSNAEATNSEVLATRGAQVDVVTTIMVHPGLGKHGVVLDL